MEDGANFGRGDMDWDLNADAGLLRAHEVHPRSSNLQTGQMVTALLKRAVGLRSRSANPSPMQGDTAAMNTMQTKSPGDHSPRLDRKASQSSLHSYDLTDSEHQQEGSWFHVTGGPRGEDQKKSVEGVRLRQQDESGHPSKDAEQQESAKIERGRASSAAETQGMGPSKEENVEQGKDAKDANHPLRLARKFGYVGGHQLRTDHSRAEKPNREKLKGTQQKSPERKIDWQEVEQEGSSRFKNRPGKFWQHVNKQQVANEQWQDEVDRSFRHPPNKKGTVKDRLKLGQLFLHGAGSKFKKDDGSI